MDPGAKHGEMSIAFVNRGLMMLWLMAVLGVFLLLVINYQDLPIMGVYYGYDGFDTLLTIKVTNEVGIIGPNPYLDTAVSIFGYYPPLFGLLGSLIDSLLDDPPLSMLVLYTLVEASIMVLLYKRFLADQPIHIRLIVCSFFLFNIIFSNLYPFGCRRRQQLALLLGMLLYLQKDRLHALLLTFLSLLAQPIAGSLMALGYLLQKVSIGPGLRLKSCPGKADVLPILLGSLLALPFYHGIIAGLSLEPAFHVCNNLSSRIVPLGPFLFIFFLFAAIFLYENRRRLGLAELFAAILIFSVPLAALMFPFIKDALPIPLFELYLRLLSLTCPALLFNIAMFMLVASMTLKGCRISQKSLFLLLLLSLIFAAHAFTELSVGEPLQYMDGYHSWASMYGENGITNVKTMMVDVFEHSGSARLVPRATLFNLQGYSLIANESLHFVDEMNMPPEMSRGGTNIVNLQLADAIIHKDGSCPQLADQLRQAGVDGVSYYVTPTYGLPEDSFLEAAGSFEDTSFLESCSLELVDYQEGYVDTYEGFFVTYRIR